MGPADIARAQTMKPKIPKKFEFTRGPPRYGGYAVRWQAMDVLCNHSRHLN